MALRLLFIGMSACEGSVENLKSFLDENSTRNQAIVDLNHETVQDKDDKEFLLTLFSLTKSTNVYSLKTHEMIIKSHPELGNIWDQHREFIEKFLHRQHQTSDLNFHGIFGSILRKDDELDRATASTNLQLPIGSASLLFASLINHSCANNVLRTCVDGKIAVIVCRPIAKGAQLFDCYKYVTSDPLTSSFKTFNLCRSNFIKDLKPERQARLLKEFGFVCECEACVGNFPTPPALNFKNQKLLKFAQKADSDMVRLPLGRAMKKFWECCEMINKHHQTFPCFELSLMQKTISLFLLRQAEPATLFP
jgi:SET domain